jgi:group I intron endonuclease
MKITDKPMIIYFVFLGEEVVYIGQSKLSLEKRKTQHEYNAKRNKGYVIGAGIRKHGAENLIWKIHSVYYNQIDLDAAEKHYIAKYKPRYCINLGGEARGLRKKSDKPSWNKGLKGSTPWNKGKKETRIEVLKNIKDGAKNRKPTNHKIGAEQRKSMVEGRIAKYRKTNKEFICHQNNKTYVLVTEAAKDLGVSATGIYAVLNDTHKMKSYKGYTFSFVQ